MKKGFTLIELLAVIIILALVLLIAIPMILGVIEKAKRGAIESDALLIIDTIKKKKAMDNMFSYTDITIDNIEEKLGIKPGNYSSITVIDDGGKPKVIITGQDKYEGYTVYGTSDDLEVVRTEDYDVTPPVITLLGDNPMELTIGDTYNEPGATASDNKDGDITSHIVITGTVNKDVLGSYTLTYNVEDKMGNDATPVTRTVTVIPISYAGPRFIESKGVNGPVLAQGMVPIKWNGSAWVDTDIYDVNWYEYGTTSATRKWANARTNDCTNPSDPATCSMWVWIPRFAYKIDTGYHVASNPPVVSAKFLRDYSLEDVNRVTVSTNPTYTGSVQNNYIKHPTFTFGTTEITGIWIAKFETSVANQSDACYTTSGSANCDKNTLVPAIRPTVLSWRFVTISNAFTVSRNMETNATYGWGTTGNNIDTHLIKNKEWGAAALLSLTTYGYNAKMWINANNAGRVGCSGTSVDAAGSALCQMHTSTDGVKSGTTGTPYGIFDMRGGSYEFTASCISNACSGISTDVKYIDSYPAGSPTVNQSNNFANASAIKGDVVYENMSTFSGYGWYNAQSSMPAGGFFMRGGTAYDGSNVSQFTFDQALGASSSISFRPVLIVESGL